MLGFVVREGGWVCGVRLGGFVGGWVCVGFVGGFVCCLVGGFVVGVVVGVEGRLLCAVFWEHFLGTPPNLF